MSDTIRERVKRKVFNLLNDELVEEVSPALGDAHNRRIAKELVKGVNDAITHFANARSLAELASPVKSQDGSLRYEGKRVQVAQIQIDTCDGVLHELVFNPTTGRYDWGIWEDSKEDNVTIRTSAPGGLSCDVRVMYQEMK